MNKVAVFARNHREYLETACAISSDDPSRLVTFRSSKVWKRIKTALNKQEIIKIYFAAIGGESNIEYDGTLKALVLNPVKGQKETESALGWDIPDTRKEGLWENENLTVRTLYLISNCRKLSSAFPITELVKASDKKPISQKYGYSYVPVEEHTTTGDDFEAHPEEVAEQEVFFEGAVRTVLVNAYERSAAARAKCIAKYGHSCVVCGFNFEDTYGDIGADFIHVHHLTQLARVDSDYQVDPIKDLRPVCPNCHAMIHRKTPPLSLEQLEKKLIRE